MSRVQVLTSTTADGSMLDRHDELNSQIIANRETFLAKNGITMNQSTRLNINLQARIDAGETNYCRYVEVTPSDFGAGMRGGDATVCDAIITKDVNHALVLPIADCAATTIYDPTHHVLMLSHLGRHSLEQQGATKSVQHLIETYHSNPKELLVWVSPSPNKDVYPIWKLDNQGMKEAWHEQMAVAGIIPENIIDNTADSATDLNYYSYSEFLKGHRDEDGDYAMVAMMTDYPLLFQRSIDS